MNKHGFTLIELLIVIAIIGILALVAVSSYIGVQKKAARSEAYSNLESLRLLEEQFFAENACYEPLAAGACPVAQTPYATTAAIQAFLPGFQPGSGPSFTYSLTTNVQITGGGYTTANPPTTGALANCFTATATGVAGTRVAGDVFAIDCNNIRNF